MKDLGHCLPRIIIALIVIPGMAIIISAVLYYFLVAK
jgi:hypothetical protein